MAPSRSQAEPSQRALHAPKATQSALHGREIPGREERLGPRQPPSRLGQRERPAVARQARAVARRDRVERRRGRGASFLERGRKHLFPATEDLGQDLVDLELGFDLRNRVLAHALDEKVDRDEIFVHDEPVCHALGHEDLAAVAEVANFICNHFGRACVNHFARDGVYVQDERAIGVHGVVNAHAHAQAAKDEPMAESLPPCGREHAMELLGPIRHE
ncbi:hypothetical protein PsorP6_015448 [Peronosclerospora sorghi]|uniref:Uncharacterized protein n=1 Tax=Peronosclerospora sorghi TaxID=230839 RepID=A0ACC0WR36_9STRA|nr:hypothetical protein PsorP6_015448 [Peronosclerospora sorghi]